MNVRRLGLVIPLVAVAGGWALQAARSVADPPRVSGASPAVALPLAEDAGDTGDGGVCPLCFPPLTDPRDLRRAIDARVDAFLARHAALQETGSGDPRRTRARVDAFLARHAALQESWWEEDEEFAWWDDWPSLRDEAYPPRVSGRASSAEAGATQGAASSVVMGDGLAIALSYAAGQYHIQVAYPTPEGSRESSLHGDRAELEAWLAGLPKPVRRVVRRQLEGMAVTEPAPDASSEDAAERLQ